MRYCMVPINTRKSDSGLLVRRVLIEYKGKKTIGDTIWLKGTRVVYKDDYFDDAKSSHKYDFLNSGYALMECGNNNNILYALFGFERNYIDYHIAKKSLTLNGINPFIKAKNDDEAKKIFISRKEYR